jgi:DNA-binding LacI/PurR family transcriptional regulator
MRYLLQVVAGGIFEQRFAIGFIQRTIHERRMASYAMQVLMLQKQFKGQQSASIVLPTELIIRESCGANLK